MNKYDRISGLSHHDSLSQHLSDAPVHAGKDDGKTQVYVNARVYTADPDNPEATAFAVRNGRFLYVGNDREALRHGPAIDMKGRRILPGLVESHAHPGAIAALMAMRCIEFTKTLEKEELLRHIREAAADDEHRELAFIIARGLDPTMTDLVAADLDRAVPDRPALLITEDWHAGLLNTRALALAGITPDTQDPLPGVSYFVRDENGNPTGYVRETTALYTTMQKMHVCTAEAIHDTLPELFHDYACYGYTACTDAGGLLLPGEELLRALRRLEQEHDLPMHFTTSYVYFGPATDSPDKALATMLRRRKDYESELIHPRILKFITDGTVEVASAWMFEDYSVEGMGHGAPLLTVDEMLPLARAAAAKGFDLHVHAIGDRAVSEALRLCLEVGPIRGTKTIAHCQVFPPDGVERFIRQGDIFFQTTANWMGAVDDFTRSMLGPVRYHRQAPAGSMVRAGIPVTFSSDSIGGEMGLNPFFNIAFAVQRSFDDGSMCVPPQSEGISVADAINAYTINGARQAGAAHEIGSITVGKYADFIELSEDVLSVPPETIKDVFVTRTFFRGQCLFND